MVIFKMAYKCLVLTYFIYFSSIEYSLLNQWPNRMRVKIPRYFSDILIYHLIHL